MKKLRMFWYILKKCQLHKFLIGFILCFFLFAVILLLFDPAIKNYADAMWYLFVSSTSIGFGDIVVTTIFGRILTVILTIYEILLVSIVCAIVVSFYIEVVHTRQEESATQFVDKMSHLSELSKDELIELENQFNEKLKKRRR